MYHEITEDSSIWDKIRYYLFRCCACCSTCCQPCWSVKTDRWALTPEYYWQADGYDYKALY